MLESTTDFIKRQVKNRRILIWGAWNEGYKILECLRAERLEISGFIDSNKGGIEYNGYPVYDTSIACKENIEKYYFIISLVDHKSVYSILKSNKFKEFEDYLYLGKSIFLNKLIGYKDIYGNTIQFLNGEKSLGEMVEVELSLGSTLLVEDGVYFGKNIKIKVTHFSTVWIKKGVRILDDTIIEAHRGGEIIIGSEAFFEGKTFIRARTNGKIIIGSKSTFNPNLHIRITHASLFECGNDCMFSYDIKIRGEDGHAIMDIKNKKRIDRKRNVKIGHHVWIGMGATLFAGTEIGNNSIVGAESFVNNQFPSNCLVIGTPARIHKTDITWDRNFDISYKEWECRNNELEN